MLLRIQFEALPETNSYFLSDSRNAPFRCPDHGAASLNTRVRHRRLQHRGTRLHRRLQDRRSCVGVRLGVRGLCLFPRANSREGGAEMFADTFGKQNGLTP